MMYSARIAFCLALFTPIVALCGESVDARAITIDGKPFVAFDQESARKLLQMRLDFPKLEITVQKQKELLQVRSKELDVLHSVLANLTSQKSILLDETVNLHKQIALAYAWYKNPYLWACVGVVLGTGATILVMYATQ